MSTRNRTDALLGPSAGSRPHGIPWPPSQVPPQTTEERLQGIEKLGQRIHGQVEFMCRIGSLNGTSTEAKDRAVTAFYDCLLELERQLARIQEAVQLG